MKNYLLLLLFIITIASCSEDEVQSENLVAEWTYQREVTSTISLIEYSDTAGIMLLFSNGEGIRESVISTYDYTLEWELENCGKEIKIKKSGFWGIDTRTYDVTKIDDENITLEGVISREVRPDGTYETIEIFTLTKN